MNPTRSFLASAAGATAVLAFLAGCSSATAAGSGSADSADSADSANGQADRQSVTVVLDWTPNTNHGGLYLAEANGWFDDAGLDVEIIEPGEASGLQLLATGHADFAYSVAESLVPARTQGVDAVSVAAIVEHNTSSLIFETASGITRPRDLEGKVYGTYGSDLENALISQLIACDGGDPEIATAPLASNDFRIGLSEDQFDYAWVFDAWDTIRLRDIDGMDVGTLPFIDYTECIPDWYTPLLATSASTLTSDPAMVRAFLDVLSRGYQEAMADPAAAADALLAAAPELDPTLVRLSADYLATRYADDAGAWGRQTPATWADFVGFLEAADLLEDGFDTDAAWTNDYLPTH